MNMIDKSSISQEPIEVDRETAEKLTTIMNDLIENGSKGVGPLSPKEAADYFEKLMTNIPQ